MIKDLKDLQALLKLCRKQGITEIKLGGTEIKFGDLPKKSSNDAADDSDEIPTEELTPEQLMFFSAGGVMPNENIQG